MDNPAQCQGRHGLRPDVRCAGRQVTISISNRETGNERTMPRVSNEQLDNLQFCKAVALGNPEKISRAILGRKVQQHFLPSYSRKAISGPPKEVRREVSFLSS